MKHLIVLISILSFTWSYSQTITFNELATLKDKDVSSAEKFLKAKGWYVFSELDPKLDNLGCIVFGLEIEENNDDFSKTGSFISYYFTTKGIVKKLEFITGSTTKYENFSRELNLSNYTVTNSFAKDGKVRKTYKINET